MLIDVAQGDDVLGAGDVAEVAAALAADADEGDVEAIVRAGEQGADFIAGGQEMPRCPPPRRWFARNGADALFGSWLAAFSRC